MKQTYLTMLLSVLMSMVGAKAFAYDIEVENADGVTIYYNVTGSSFNNLEVTYRNYDPWSDSNDYVGNVVIPESVTYNGNVYSVTSIGFSAFYRCSGLTELTIPNSVISIGESAFRDCSGLTELTIPNSVTSIGDRAFSNCSGLTGQLIIPNSVTSIGEAAFRDCSGLAELTIPNSVTSIGNNAFSGCSGLTELTIPNSITSIGSFAFSDCI